MNSIYTLVRPHQYVKNLFIFLPLFFAGQFTNTDLLINAVLAFISFSFSASAIYILNDFKDISEDRLHPKKKYRPLAANLISKNSAIVLMFILLIIGITLMSRLSVAAVSILAIYIALNIAYSFYLKHISILDVTIIAIGFVLRLFIGSSVTGIPLSMWIVIMTYLLAFFIALAKRRDDVLIFLDTGKKMRKVIEGYNIALIDGAMLIMATVVIVSYILYTTSVEVVQRLNSEYVYLTSIFVISGILRYLQIAYVENDTGSPTTIVLKDGFMKLTILAWVSSFVWIIYL